MVGSGTATGRAGFKKIISLSPLGPRMADGRCQWGIMATMKAQTHVNAVSSAHNEISSSLARRVSGVAALGPNDGQWFRLAGCLAVC